MKKATILATVLAIAAMACSLPAAAQQYGSFKDTGGGLVTTQPWCWEATQGAGYDACLKRIGAGVLAVDTAPVGGTPNLTPLNALGSYQGTTSVGITDTAFHALVAAASDVSISANLINTAGKAIRIHGEGVYTNAAASLLNAEIMLCQVSGCATGTVVAPAGCAVTTTNQANNLTNGQFTIDCNLISSSTVGASGTFMAKSQVCTNLGAATSAVLSCFSDTATAVSAAVDETKAEFVNPAFKFSTSNAGNSAILHLLTVEVIR